MKITVMRDGVSGKDEHGDIYKINGLVIKKDRGSNILYSPDDNFFKVACPYNTSHDATVNEDETVNLY